MLKTCFLGTTYIMMFLANSKPQLHSIVLPVGKGLIRRNNVHEQQYHKFT